MDSVPIDKYFKILLMIQIGVETKGNIEILGNPLQASLVSIDILIGLKFRLLFEMLGKAFLMNRRDGKQ